MNKSTRLNIFIIVLTSLVISSAFNLKSKGKPSITNFCGSNVKSSSGISGRTQSPSDLLNNPNSCEGCHSGGSTIPTINLTANPAFGPGNTYVPGTNYTITYTVTGYPYYGFDLEIDNGNTSTSTALGTLSKGTYTKISSSEVLHTLPIPIGSSATFNWTAPNSGTAYLYSTALGVNGTGNTSGDKQAFYNLVLTPTSLGIEEVIIQNNDIKIFPNPSKESAIIYYFVNKNTHIKIDITDLNGKVLSSQIDEEASKGLQTKQLDLSNLNASTYFVKITSDNQIVTKKIVIQ